MRKIDKSFINGTIFNNIQELRNNKFYGIL